MKVSIAQLLKEPWLIDSMSKKQMKSFIREALFVKYNQFIETNVELLQKLEEMESRCNSSLCLTKRKEE